MSGFAWPRTYSPFIFILFHFSNNWDHHIAHGKINFVEEKVDWIATSGNSFDLLLPIGSIHGLWLVHRPTTVDITSSLEFYDLKGVPIALFFGDRRKKGDEEAVWRDILSALPSNDCL